MQVGFVVLCRRVTFRCGRSKSRAMSFFSKFLVFLLGLAVFAAVAAWIMGGESEKQSTRISIEASPNSVFRYLVEEEKIKAWASDIVSAGPYKDEEEEGSFETLERIVTEDGGQTVWEDSVMRFKRGEAISIQSRKGGLTTTTVFQLERNDIGGTNLDYRVIKSASGLEQFMFSFQKKDSKTKMATEMSRLKKLIESEVVLGSAEDNEGEFGDPVVADSDTDNNGSSEMLAPANASTQSDGPSVIDQVLGPAESIPTGEAEDGQRNFEKLFGTGR